MFKYQSPRLLNSRIYLSHLLIFVFINICNQAFADNPKRGIVWEGEPNSTEVNKQTPPLNYKALVIANYEYPSTEKSWPSLKTPKFDANAFSTLLTEKYGFKDVYLLQNATRKETLASFRDLALRLEENDGVIIYYAGHGYLDKNLERGYWIPVDVKGLDSSTFIRNSTIRDELLILSKTARHVVLVSDSCFSGNLINTLSDPTNQLFPAKNNTNLHQIQILSAGGEEYVDDVYQDTNHSPFSYFLLKTLNENNNETVSFSHIALSVKSAVNKISSQSPQYGYLNNNAANQSESDLVLSLNNGNNNRQPIIAKQSNSISPELEVVDLPRLIRPPIPRI